MLEWKSGEDSWDDESGEWTSPTAERWKASESEKTEPQNRHRQIIIVLSAVIAFAVVGVVGLRWRTNRNVQTARADVQRVVNEEMWALGTEDWELYHSLLSSGAPGTWYEQEQARFQERSQSQPPSAEVTDLEFVGAGLALAEIRVDPHTRPPYRTTHAYRQVQNTWRRAPAPDGRPWLRTVVHETQDLRFIYHPADADRLEPLFPSLQEFYVQLLIDFGLSSIPNKRELQIVLSVQPADPPAVPRSRRYDLSSMTLMAERERIKRELASQLTDQVMDQFYGDAEMPLVLDAISRWEVGDWMGDPLADSRQDLSRSLAEVPFVPLLMLQPTYSNGIPVAPLTETAVAYLVDSEGRDVLNALVEAAVRYHEWPTLLDQGLGLSYDRVADRWWASVKQRYAPSRTEPQEMVRAGLQWMLKLEQRALAERDARLFRSLLDPRASLEWWNSQMRRFRIGGEPGLIDPDEIHQWGYEDGKAWATVELRRRRPSMSLFVTDFRFLRFGEHRWYLTSPAAWPRLEARTEHLVFRYRQPDAGLISSLAEEAETLYAQLLRDLGMDAQHRKRATIRFNYFLDPTTSFYAEEPADVQLPSPQFYRDQGAFRVGLGYYLADNLLKSEAGLRESGQVMSLLNGIAIWEAEQWGEYPLWEAQKYQEPRYALQGNTRLLSNADPFALRFLIAGYVAETYGRHRFADILQAAKEYEDLEQLIPAALDVDLEDFEAGWRSYLQRSSGSTTP